MLDAFSYINRSAESRNSFYKFMAMPSDDPPHGPYGPKAVVPAGGYYRRATSTVIPGAIALSSIAELRDPLESELPPEEHAYIARHHDWEAGSEEREAEQAAEQAARDQAAQQRQEDGWWRDTAARDEWMEAMEALVEVRSDEAARREFSSTTSVNLGFGGPF
jgi:hypothetical protein